MPVHECRESHVETGRMLGAHTHRGKFVTPSWARPAASLTGRPQQGTSHWLRLTSNFGEGGSIGSPSDVDNFG